MSNYDLNRHKKSDKIKWIITGIAFVLAFVMIVGICMQLFAKDDKYKPSHWFEKTEQTEKLPDNKDGEDKEQTTPEAADNSSVKAMARSVQLMSAVAEAETGISQTVTAEVLPANAENKNVDWSLTWIDGVELSSQDISNYATATPTADGSTTVTLNFKMAFRGSNMLLTVTTREGGYTDSTIIEYVGKPSELSVNNGSSGVCGFSQSAEFGITLSNIFDDVGESFYNNLAVKSVTVDGTYTSCTQSYSASGVEETNVKTGDSIANLYLGGNSSAGTVADTITATISNKKLVVTSSDVLTNYFNHSAGSGGNYTMYGAIKGDLNVYADIVVSCGSLEKTIRVSFRASTTGVNMSTHKIEI